jgi:sensor domain CHASE-containing protein
MMSRAAAAKPAAAEKPYYLTPPFLAQAGKGFVIAALTGVLMGTTVWAVKKAAVSRFERNLSALRDQSRLYAQANSSGLLAALDGFSRELAEAPAISDADFKARAEGFLKKEPRLAALNFADKDYVIRSVYPEEPGRAALGQDIKSRFDTLPAAHQAVAERRVVPTGRVDLSQGGKGVIFYVPLWDGKTWKGVVEAVAREDGLSAFFADDNVRKKIAVSIIDQSTGRDVASPQNAVKAASPYDTYFSVKMGPRTWWVILTPRSYPLILPYLVLLLLAELSAGAWLILRWAAKAPDFR